MTTVINKGQIGEQDIYRFDGSGTNTFTRDTSTGATLTLNKFGYEVNALTAYGGGTVLTDATITAALTALGAVTPCTLLITPGAWTISNDLTITSNIVLKVAAGATLEVAAGKTLTIEGPIDAPSLDIFTGTGTTTITTTNSLTQGIWTGSTGFTFGGNITATTAKLTTGAALGSILKSDAAGLLSYLAAGSANFKLFMNAGATAPEWAGGFYIGSFERSIDADSGDVAYTSVGFKPSCVIFLAMHSGGVSIGFDTITGKETISIFGNGPTYTGAGSVSIYIFQTDINTSQRANVKTFDSDGFTLTWVKAGSPSGTTIAGYYLAFR